MYHRHALQSAAAASLARTLGESLTSRMHAAPRGPHVAPGNAVSANAAPRWRTRFAPAPTGYLHLGHVVNAIHVWGIARAFGGDVVLRIEDHDRSRCRTEYEAALLDDLEWLGFVPDIGSIHSFRIGRTSLRQSDNLRAYDRQLSALTSRSLVYACRCSRKEVSALSAHEPGVEARYPGSCRELAFENSDALAKRVRVGDDAESFVDLRLGVQEQKPSSQCGDFVVRDRNGNFTYQFAVTVDDMQQDIALVVRGEDLLSSTGRQIQLARLLGRAAPPLFLHHQLIMRADGIKLSKSAGDTGVREMRAAGLSAAEVLGRAAFSSGLLTQIAPLEQSALAGLFV